MIGFRVGSLRSSLEYSTTVYVFYAADRILLHVVEDHILLHVVEDHILLHVVENVFNVKYSRLT
jgi:hypothetical protein